jgi:copper resistance protein D
LPDALICMRAIHFAATILAAGVAFFAAFIAEPAFRKAAESSRVPALIRHQLRWVGWIGLAVAVLSGAAWLVLTAQSMSGRPAAEVLSEGVIWTVLGQTDFGRDWLVRAVLACLLGVAFVPLAAAQQGNPRWRMILTVVLAAAFVGSLAWAGHAIGGRDIEGIVHPAADVLHLVAAAAWVGALIPLVLLLHAAGQDSSPDIARVATLRFSTFGVVTVGAILVTGLVNTWYLAGSITALTGTDYGRLLLAKIAVFLVMVAIAAVNRIHLTPLIAQGGGAAMQGALRQLRRNAMVEVSAGAVVIVIVAVLGTLPPASHAHHLPASGAIPADAAFQHIHSEQGMADVTIEPGRTGTSRATIRLWDEDTGTIEAKEVTVTLTAPTAGKPQTRAAALNSDGMWQADGIELTEPGAWTVTVDAVLGSGSHLVLRAPILIEPKE